MSLRLSSKVVVMLGLLLVAPAYATTMLLRGETVVGQVKYCIYSMSSASEQHVITQPYYMSCRKMISL